MNQLSEKSFLCFTSAVSSWMQDTATRYGICMSLAHCSSQWDGCKFTATWLASADWHQHYTQFDTYLFSGAVKDIQAADQEQVIHFINDGLGPNWWSDYICPCTGHLIFKLNSCPWSGKGLSALFQILLLFNSFHQGRETFLCAALHDLQHFSLP